MPITVSGTSIVFNDSTTQTTAFTSAVTSLNGQTGAITNTGYGNIGSYFAGYLSADLNTNNTRSANDTISGSGLILNTSNGSGSFDPLSPGTTNTNAGLSGTWRVMTRSKNSSDGEGNWQSPGFLCVRIS